jgi:hypothetical protein
MVKSHKQNSGQNHNIQMGNKSFKMVEESKYLGTLTNQNSVHEEIKSRLKSGNAWYHFVQNLLLSSLLSKNINMQNYNFACCFYGCETWSLTLREEHRLKVFKTGC